MATPIEDLTELAVQYSDAADEAIATVSTAAAIALIATPPSDQAEAVLLRVAVGQDTHAAAAVMRKRPAAVRVAAPAARAASPSYSGVGEFG